ncbi:MAG: hypothetical protein AAGG01_13125 [Planctomycetota bacterium]
MIQTLPGASALLTTLLLFPVQPAMPLSQEGPVELSSEVILPHELSIFAVAADVSGKRIFTVDQIGVVRGWELDELDPSKPLWESAKHTFGDERAIANVFDLSIGDEVGARTGPSPVPSFDSIQLDSGAMGSGMGSSLGGRDMNDMNATKAVLVDPKDRWIWIGAERGVARLMAKGVSGWSQRGVPNGGTVALAVDPKAKELALGGKDGTIRFVGNTSCDVDEKSVFEGHGASVVDVAWHPKGKLVASIAGAGEVIFHRRRGGKVDFKLEHEKASFTRLAFHPKGKWLAVGTKKGGVLVYDLKAKKLIAEGKLPKAVGGVHSLAVLDKGRVLVAAGKQSIVRIDVEGALK